MGFAAGFAAGSAAVERGFAIRDKREQRKLEQDERDREDRLRESYISKRYSEAGIPDPNAAMDTGADKEAIKTSDVANPTNNAAGAGVPEQEPASGVTPTQAVPETTAASKPDVSASAEDPYQVQKTPPSADGERTAMPETPVKTEEVDDASSRGVYRSFNTLTPTYKQWVQDEADMIRNLPRGSTFADMVKVTEYNRSRREKYFFSNLSSAKNSLENQNLPAAAASLKKMWSALPNGQEVDVVADGGQLIAITRDEETGKVVGTPRPITAEMLTELEDNMVKDPSMFGMMDANAMYERRIKELTFEKFALHKTQVDDSLKTNALSREHTRQKMELANAEEQRKQGVQNLDIAQKKANLYKTQVETRNAQLKMNLDYIKEWNDNNKGTLTNISGMKQKDQQKYYDSYHKYMSKQTDRLMALGKSEGYNEYMNADGSIDPSKVPNITGWTPALTMVMTGDPVRRINHEVLMGSVGIINKGLPAATAANISAELMLAPPKWENSKNGRKLKVPSAGQGSGGYTLEVDYSSPTNVYLHYNGKRYVAPPELGTRASRLDFSEKHKVSWVQDPSLPWPAMATAVYDANGELVDGNQTISGKPAVTQEEKKNTEQGQKVGAAQATVNEAQNQGALPDPQEKAKRIDRLPETLAQLQQQGKLNPQVAAQMLPQLQAVDTNGLTDDQRQKLEASIAQLQSLASGGQQQAVPVQ